MPVMLPVFGRRRSDENPISFRWCLRAYDRVYWGNSDFLTAVRFPLWPPWRRGIVAKWRQYRLIVRI